MNHKILIRKAIFILFFFLVSYASYFILKREVAIDLAMEDNLFESVTALVFFGTAFFFFRCFRATRNLYFIVLVLVFFFGGCEEISWGQRLFGFETPESVNARNRQNEFNLHNIDIFHPQEEGGITKSGLSKVLTIDFLYNLFWLGWCIVVPLLNYMSFFKNLFSKIKLPIPSLPLGLFFLINFAIFYVTRSFISDDKSDLYYMRYREVFECCSAIVFLFIGTTFYRNTKVAAIVNKGV